MYSIVISLVLYIMICKASAEGKDQPFQGQVTGEGLVLTVGTAFG